MPTYAQQLARLKRIIVLAEKLIADMPKPRIGRPALVSTSIKSRSSKKRVRRSGKELAAFRAMLKAERKKGVPAADLAKQHGVSLAYIYQL